jgi:hypothetical protein
MLKATQNMRARDYEREVCDHKRFCDDRDSSEDWTIIVLVFKLLPPVKNTYW